MGHYTEKKQLQTVDGPMDVIVSATTDTVRGGVVVVQEAFGLTGHIERVCEALADAGYLAIAPALFHRCEEQIFGYGDYEKLGPVIMSMTGEGIATDIDVAFKELDRNRIPASRTAIMGFCMGGTVTLATAARKEIGAAVTFYGSGIAEGRFGIASGLDNAENLRTPWLGFYGDLDANIPIDDVERLRVAAATAPVDTEIVRYAEADHGFHCDERPSFHAESSSDAWQRTLTFLDEHLH